jgi:hypothetical protein
VLPGGTLVHEGTRSTTGVATTTRRT